MSDYPMPPDLRRWAKKCLQTAGVMGVGPPELVKHAPWAAVWSFDTPNGRFFAKSCSRTQAHEPALTTALARWRPDCCLPVVAADVENGWLLLPDGGETLAEIRHRDRSQAHAHWPDILALMAGVQQDTAGKSAELLNMGLLDRRPNALPGAFDELLDTLARRPDSAPGALSAAELDRLHTLRPNLVAAVQRLDALGIPATLNHDDLHDKHIFLDGNRYQFYDWGDACLSHPFFVLVVPYERETDGRWPPDESDFDNPLFRPYWQAWAGEVSIEAVRAAFPDMLALGALDRALTWERAMGSRVRELPPRYLSIYAEGLPLWLARMAGCLEPEENKLFDR